jgi:thiol-disulfide isomerase/thioredoxin
VTRLWLLVLAATLVLMYFLQHQGIELSSSKDFVFHLPPRPLPAVAVSDSDGSQVRTLDDLRGRFVLLNLWATWCVPCRKEMPTLDRLQQQLGGPDFEVVALSVDKGGAEAVRRFYGANGIQRLSVRVAANPEKALAALGVYGLPTTLLIDRQSGEIARLIGSANWDSKDVIDFLKAKIAPEN